MSVLDCQMCHGVIYLEGGTDEEALPQEILDMPFLDRWRPRAGPNVSIWGKIRIEFKLLHSASIWRHFAAFCIILGLTL